MSLRDKVRLADLAWVWPLPVLLAVLEKNGRVRTWERRCVFRFPVWPNSLRQPLYGQRKTCCRVRISTTEMVTGVRGYLAASPRWMMFLMGAVLRRCIRSPHRTSGNMMRHPEPQRGPGHHEPPRAGAERACCVPSRAESDVPFNNDEWK